MIMLKAKAKKKTNKANIRNVNLTPVKKLKKQAEEMWKAIAIIRDGKECQVLKHYPQIDILHTEVYQVDHCFSRSNKNLFFDVQNSTVVCSSCNMLKGFDSKAVDVAIHEIVRKREGEDSYNRMKEIAMSRTANINFSKRWWLEEQIAILREIYQGMGKESLVDNS